MKTPTLLLALSSLLSAAHAQQAPAAAQPAAPYQGPKVVKHPKSLGKEMVQKSKPTDAIRTSVRELPVKK